SAIRESILQDHSLSVYQIGLIKERSLPKTTSGKIRRAAIQKALLEKQLICKMLWTRSINQAEDLDQKTDKPLLKKPQNSNNQFIQNLRNQIHSELSDMLNIEKDILDDSKNFAEFGLDSLMAVELEARLQNYLKESCYL